MAIENLLTYTEVDSDSDITLSVSAATFDTIRGDAVSYVYYDFGADYFADFEIEFEVDGKKGVYNRSRSGCFFCFYQRKIEWIWLYERHPDLFRKAQQYEKDGYSWMDNETLEQIIQPERIAQIKLDYIATLQKKLNKNKSNKLVDILADDIEVCANCFI